MISASDRKTAVELIKEAVASGKCICGIFYYLYLFSALYDRSIVGWEVYEEESADCVSSLILFLVRLD